MIKNQEKPHNAFRMTLELATPRSRIDQILREELKKQSRNVELRDISRTAFKELFKKRRIQIKGQSAIPSSSIAQGTTHIDILGFSE